MFNFIMGCVVGFVVASLGVANTVNMLDNAVSSAKDNFVDRVEETIQK